MRLLQSINIEDDFWKLNPEIKYMSPFKEFYDSNDNNYSSKIMWAIYLMIDPDSRFYRIDTEEKQKEICENYLNTDDLSLWEDETIKKLISSYKDRLLSKLQRSYLRLMSKLEERDNFILNTKYNEKNAKALDGMLTNSSTIFQQLVAIEAELDSEKKAANIKGGRTESLSEKGIL